MSSAGAGGARPCGGARAAITGKQGYGEAGGEVCPGTSFEGDSSRLCKIVSGGQTGADRAGLDWAIAAGVPHGGWCPRGRKAEDGSIDEKYLLKESQSKGYRERTELNARDSDGTAIFTGREDLTGGSLLTARMADRHRRPWIHLSVPAGVAASAEALRRFAIENRIAVLNVAGNRESRCPEIQEFVRQVLNSAFNPAHSST